MLTARSMLPDTTPREAESEGVAVLELEAGRRSDDSCREEPGDGWDVDADVPEFANPLPGIVSNGLGLSVSTASKRSRRARILKSAAQIEAYTPATMTSPSSGKRWRRRLISARWACGGRATRAAV
jgi:hypothetical protein